MFIITDKLLPTIKRWCISYNMLTCSVLGHSKKSLIILRNLSCSGHNLVFLQTCGRTSIHVIFLLDVMKEENLQAVQVHHFLHLFHLSRGLQEVQERCLQTGFLGALALPVDQEVLEAPDGRQGEMSQSHSVKILERALGCIRRYDLMRKQ